MFYQSEYTYIYNWINNLTSCKSKDASLGTYIPISTANKLISTALNLKSIDFPDLDSSWAREQLTSSEVDELCDRYKRTLDFNKVIYDERYIDWFKTDLIAIADDRKSPIHSFVLYRRQRSDFFDEESSLYLIDQITKDSWEINLGSPYFNNHEQLGSLYCHAISSQLREVELSKATDIPLDLLNIASLPVVSKYEADLDSDKDDEFDEEIEDEFIETWIPLAYVRNNLIIPHHNINKINITPEEVFYISGFAGLALWGNWSPSHLMAELDSGMDLCEISEGNWYATFTTLLACSVICSRLAKKGIPNLTNTSSAFEAKLFRQGYPPLGIYQIAKPLASLLIMPFELEDYSGYITAFSPFVEDITGKKDIDNLIPTTMCDKNNLNLLYLLYNAENIQIISNSQLDNSSGLFITPTPKYNDSAIVVGTFLIRGTLDGVNKLWRGVNEILIDNEYLFRRHMLKFIQDLTDQEIVSLSINASAEGFNQHGLPSLTDPCHYTWIKHPYSNHTRLRQNKEIILGDFGGVLNINSIITNFLNDNEFNYDQYRHQWNQLINDLGNQPDISTMAIRIQLSKLLDRITKEFISGTSISSIRTYLKENTITHDFKDNIAHLSFYQCMYMEGIYVTEHTELPSDYTSQLLLGFVSETDAV